MRESFGQKSPRKPPRAARIAHAAKSPKTSNAPQHRSPKKPLSFNIIAGKYRGKSLEMALLPSTRPTKAIVREAVFNMLGGVVQNSVFIEVFAGFGSNGFEAFSRGAKRVIFIEKNPAAFGILQKNIARFGEAKFGSGAGFGGARGANLGGAGRGNLGDAGCDFGGAGFNGANLGGFWRDSERLTECEGKNCGARFDGANLDGVANLKSANLAGENGANLSDESPSAANLGGETRGVERDFGDVLNLKDLERDGANRGSAGLGGVNPSPANPRPLNLLAENPATAKSCATDHNAANLGGENGGTNGGGVGFSNANPNPKKPSVANPNTLNQSAPAPATAGFSAGFVGESPNLANFSEVKLALNPSDAGFGDANSGGLNLGGGAARNAKRGSEAIFGGANLGTNPNAQKPSNAGFSAGFTNSNHSAANLNAAGFATLAPNAPRFALSRGKDSLNAPSQSLDFRPADSHGKDLGFAASRKQDSRRKGSPAKDLDATPSCPTDFLGFSPSHDADVWGADSLKNADKGTLCPASSQSLDSPAQFAVSNSTPSRSVDFYGEDSPQGDFAGAEISGAAQDLERDFGGSSAAQGNLGEAGCDFGGEDARLKETRLSGVNLGDSGLSGARFKDSQPKNSHSKALTPTASHSPRPAPCQSASGEDSPIPAPAKPQNPALPAAQPAAEQTPAPPNTQPAGAHSKASQRTVSLPNAHYADSTPRDSRLSMLRPTPPLANSSPAVSHGVAADGTPSPSADLCGRDLGGVDFRGVDVSADDSALTASHGANFQGLDFSNAPSPNANVWSADFRGVDALNKEPRGEASHGVDSSQRFLPQNDSSGAKSSGAGLSGARFKDSQGKDSSNAYLCPTNPSRLATSQSPVPANPPRSLSRQTPQCPAFSRPKNPPSALPNSTPPRPSPAQSLASPQKSPPNPVLPAISPAILPVGARFKAQPAAAQTPAQPRANPPSQAQPTTASPTAPAPASSPDFLAFNADCFLLLENLATRFGADIFYFDPPFDAGIYARCFEAIARLGLGGKVLVFECDSSASMPQNLGALTLAKLRRFGRTSVAIYQ